MHLRPEVCHRATLRDRCLDTSSSGCGPTSARG
jgi:hypothetical protein